MATFPTEDELNKELERLRKQHLRLSQEATSLIASERKRQKAAARLAEVTKELAAAEGLYSNLFGSGAQQVPPIVAAAEANVQQALNSVDPNSVQQATNTIDPTNIFRRDPDPDEETRRKRVKNDQAIIRDRPKPQGRTKPRMKPLSALAQIGATRDYVAERAEKREASQQATLATLANQMAVDDPQADPDPPAVPMIVDPQATQATPIHHVQPVIVNYADPTASTLPVAVTLPPAATVPVTATVPVSTAPPQTGGNYPAPTAITGTAPVVDLGSVTPAEKKQTQANIDNNQGALNITPTEPAAQKVYGDANEPDGSAINAAAEAKVVKESLVHQGPNATGDPQVKGKGKGPATTPQPSASPGAAGPAQPVSEIAALTQAIKELVKSQQRMTNQLESGPSNQGSGGDKRKRENDDDDEEDPEMQIDVPDVVPWAEIDSALENDFATYEEALADYAKQVEPEKFEKLKKYQLTDLVSESKRDRYIKLEEQLAAATSRAQRKKIADQLNNLRLNITSAADLKLNRFPMADVRNERDQAKVDAEAERIRMEGVTDMQVDNPYEGMEQADMDIDEVARGAAENTETDLGIYDPRLSAVDRKRSVEAEARRQREAMYYEGITGKAYSVRKITAERDMRDMYQAVDYKATETLNALTDQLGVPDAIFSGINDITLGPEDPDNFHEFLTGTVPGARGILAGLALKEKTGSDMVKRAWDQWSKTIDMYFKEDNRNKWAPLVANATEALLVNLEPYMDRLFGVYATDVSNRLQILAATVRGVAYFDNLKLQAQNMQATS